MCVCVCVRYVCVCVCVCVCGHVYIVCVCEHGRVYIVCVCMCVWVCVVCVVSVCVVCVCVCLCVFHGCSRGSSLETYFCACAVKCRKWTVYNFRKASFSLWMLYLNYFCISHVSRMFLFLIYI